MMCKLCNHGTLGRSPDGETVHCTCREGWQAALDESRARLMAYAEQLEQFDQNGDLPDTMRAQRDEIQIAFDAECIWHDHCEQQIEQL